MCMWNVSPWQAREPARSHDVMHRQILSCFWWIMTRLLGRCDSTPGDVSGDTGTFSESRQKNPALKSNLFRRQYLKWKSSQPNRVALLRRSLQYQLRESQALASRNEPRALGPSTLHLCFFSLPAENHLHRFSPFDSLTLITKISHHRVESRREWMASAWYCLRWGFCTHTPQMEQ